MNLPRPYALLAEITYRCPLHCPYCSNPVAASLWEAPRRPPVFVEALAASQGGGYTEIIRTTDELGPATERIAEELNHQYMIGYTPTTRADGKYHSVRVRVANKAYIVRARRGVVR